MSLRAAGSQRAVPNRGFRPNRVPCAIMAARRCDRGGERCRPKPRSPPNREMQQKTCRLSPYRKSPSRPVSEGDYRPFSRTTIMTASHRAVPPSFAAALASLPPPSPEPRLATAHARGRSRRGLRHGWALHARCSTKGRDRRARATELGRAHARILGGSTARKARRPQFPDAGPPRPPGAAGRSSRHSRIAAQPLLGKAGTNDTGRRAIRTPACQSGRLSGPGFMLVTPRHRPRRRQTPSRPGRCRFARPPNLELGQKLINPDAAASRTRLRLLAARWAHRRLGRYRVAFDAASPGPEQPPVNTPRGLSPRQW